MRLFDQKIDGNCPNCGGPHLWDCWLPFPTDYYLGPWEAKNVIRCRNCRWWKKVENVEGSDRPILSTMSGPADTDNPIQA